MRRGLPGGKEENKREDAGRQDVVDGHKRTGQKSDGVRVDYQESGGLQNLKLSTAPAYVGDVA